MSSPANPVAGAGTSPAPDVFQSLTRPLAVKYRFDEVNPPTNLYITLDDQFTLNVFSIDPNLGNVVIIRTRLLRPDGQITISQQQVSIPSLGLQTFPFTLAEGYLLSMTVATGSPVGLSNNYFVFVLFQKGAGTGFLSLQTMTLLAGYPQRQIPLSWPNQQPIDPKSGPGHLQAIAGNVPAAGNNTSDVVPSGQRWRVLSMRVSLTTAVAVSNRVLRITITRGALLAAFGPNFTQTASLTVGYNFVIGAQPPGVIGTNEEVCPLPYFVLEDNDRIQTSVDGIQAADQLTGVEYFVESWYSGF